MFNPTNAQKMNMEIFKFQGHDLFVKLVRMGLDADAAVVSLPHTNEDGQPTKHGANRVMHQLCRSYFNAAQALALDFHGLNRGREYFPYMVLRHRACRIGMPKWMSDVIAKNDGNIPATQAEVTDLGGVIFTTEGKV